MVGYVNAEKLIKQLGDDTLFVIERNIDRDVVAFQAVMNKERDEIVGIRCFWVNADNITERHDVSESAKRVIYGTEMKRVKRGHYLMQMNVFVGEKDNRIINLHIKKGKDGKPNYVVAKVAALGFDVTLHKLYADLTMIPPSINELWLCGTFESKPIEDKISVSPSIIDRVDVSDFMPKSFGF